jgi:type I restriction enzyme S subunit
MSKTQLPVSWELAPLGDIVRVLDNRRVPINAKERASRNGPIPYYGANGQVGWIDDYLFDDNLVLLAEDGGRFDEPGSAVAYTVSGKCWVNNHAHVLKPRFGIPVEFLKANLNATHWMPHVSGSTRLKLNQRSMRRVLVPVPPLNEQRRIVARIEELTARSRRAREALEAVPPLLDKLRQSVLAAAFSGRLTADWRANNPDVEPAHVLLERIKKERRQRWEETELAKTRAKGKEPKNDNWKAKYKEPEPVDTTDLPELPEGWCWASIDELSRVVRGASPRPAGDPRYFGGRIPWITVAELTKDNDKHLHSVATFVTDEGRRKSRYIAAGELLLTNSGATLGVPKITCIGGCINDGSVALLGLNGVVQDFLYHFLGAKTDWFRSLNQGAAQPNLNTAIVKSVLVPLPPGEEAHLVVRRLEQVARIASALRQVLNSGRIDLESLETAVLSKAYRGQLVPQDPSDEPASVLLERIRAQREEEEREAASRSSRLRGSKGGSRTRNRKGAKDAKSTPYTSTNPDLKAAEPDLLQAALDHLQTIGTPQSKDQILQALNQPDHHWPQLRQALTTHPKILTTGQKRGTRYQWVNK